MRSDMKTICLLDKQLWRLSKPQDCLVIASMSTASSIAIAEKASKGVYFNSEKSLKTIINALEIFINTVPIIIIFQSII